MAVAIVTGAAGLVGAECVRFLSEKGLKVVGIDNDMRRTLFGDDASTSWSRRALVDTISDYEHHDIDIRNRDQIDVIFSKHATDIRIVVHAAAQPSHDWAAREPETDFSINATATMGLLESTRKHCRHATFVFTSTNKVYGDNPNRLPLVEMETRWELDKSHSFSQHGVDETMSVDHTTHSLFGVSKLAADAMVQEYGRYFRMNTVCFRGGCLTGPGHSGASLHGFLSYLVKCSITGDGYTIIGYGGKQVRDNIHVRDLVSMFWHYHQAPRPSEVYNAGGGRDRSCSILEAVQICDELTGKNMDLAIDAEHRVGDHIWYISDTRKFQSHYPDWSFEYSLPQIIREIHDGLSSRL